jgi:hypothetical protein
LQECWFQEVIIINSSRVGWAICFVKFCFLEKLAEVELKALGEATGTSTGTTSAATAAHKRQPAASEERLEQNVGIDVAAAHVMTELVDVLALVVAATLLGIAQHGVRLAHLLELSLLLLFDFFGFVRETVF